MNIEHPPPRPLPGPDHPAPVYENHELVTRVPVLGGEYETRTGRKTRHGQPVQASLALQQPVDVFRHNLARTGVHVHLYVHLHIHI